MRRPSGNTRPNNPASLLPPQTRSWYVGLNVNGCHGIIGVFLPWLADGSRGAQAGRFRQGSWFKILAKTPKLAVPRRQAFLAAHGLHLL